MFLVSSFVAGEIKPPETTPKTSSQDFNFELYNKLQETIHVKLMYYERRGDIVPVTEIKPMGKVRAKFLYKNNNEPIELLLKILNESKQLLLNKWLKPCPQEPCKKTLYVTLDKDEAGNYRLRPQTGTYRGLSGKTDSGLNKANNIKALIETGKNQNINDIY